MSDKVTRTEPNPEFQELTELLVRAREAVERVGGVLRRPAALMLADQVWTGATTATVFASDLDGRRADLPSTFEQFADAVEERRSRVPATVDVPVSEL